ncbi:MAG: 4'-phosphopantetheinyl transferase family protein [Cyclobacteriaceae bacterium]
MITIDTIRLIRKDWQGEAILGILDRAAFNNIPKKEVFLHNQELAYYKELQYEQKRRSYLAGRYIAKKCLAQLSENENLDEIWIRSGVFDQPVVSGGMPNPPSVSISHTKEVAACIVSPREHPMGLDAEDIGFHKADIIESQLTSHEKSLCQDRNIDISHFYVFLWTAKEALSKVLTTGLMTPLSIYQIETMNFYNDHIVSTFLNFGQYKAITFWKNSTIFSIVLPKNTRYDILQDQQKADKSYTSTLL